MQYRSSGRLGVMVSEIGLGCWQLGAADWGDVPEPRAMEEAKICLQHADCDSLQIIFNIFRQKPIDELFAEAKEKGVAIIVRLPLASGLLAGTYKRDTAFAASDHRNYNRNGEKFNVGETFAGLEFARGVELADRIRAWVPSGPSMAEFAIRRILDHDAVTSVIPGASKPQQAISNARPSDLVLCP